MCRFRLAKLEASFARDGRLIFFPMLHLILIYEFALLVFEPPPMGATLYFKEHSIAITKVHIQMKFTGTHLKII